MTKHARERAELVRSKGIVDVKKSGAVVVDWSKAVKSELFKSEARKMQALKPAK